VPDIYVRSPAVRAASVAPPMRPALHGTSAWHLRPPDLAVCPAAIWAARAEIPCSTVCPGAAAVAWDLPWWVNRCRLRSARPVGAVRPPTVPVVAASRSVRRRSASAT